MRIELPDWSSARAEAVPVRFRVFVEEQQVPAELELDAHDATSVHALGRDDAGAVVATGRLLPDGHIGRMAVLAAWRGRGVGGKILEALVAEAARRGFPEAVLSAQVRAIAFYANHAFLAEGPTYVEAGIPHRLMRRRLV